ncbi:DEAD-box ATP-dependent RNA helicase FANCM-like [Bidens hawaiensis]|uniref:DEAD-box ATP-dependent RNA helicase FANCM-like n=1 Tax=Bidens hawaiensis TaxID=980011 RepID=UPI00404A2D09
MAMIDGVDDDDGFDWVEAVALIDAACNNNNNKSGNTNNKPPPTTSSSSSSCCRQSTLDRFVVSKPTSNHEEILSDDLVGNDQSIDPETAKTWIYPEHPSVRDYQVSITKTALFENTLVSLPTGLGKTLIAAVIMYNYYRWFPKGKIVFAAPSRPLVMQQIEACHNIVDIKQKHAVDLTGQTSPSLRASLWKDKQVFYVTPQVLEKDIQSGTCPVKQLVCLVIDEAHRASGNHSYCVAVRKLMAVPVHLRILALTATPGTNLKTVQQVINNLQISRLEYRSDNDPDVIHYVHTRKIELIQVQMGKDATDANKLLMDVIHVHVKKLNNFGILPKRDPQTLSPVDFLRSKENFHKFPPQNLDPMKYSEVEASLTVLITLYHIRKLLSSHGIRPAYDMLEEKLKQGHFARLFSRNETIHKAKLIMQQNLSHGVHSPKFSKMLEILIEHFKKQDPQKSRVIIFSHFRESVRGIMSSLATIGEHVKATEFVGQSSGKTSKGQSQKVQQAVLQKFRAGGYNVIVATSIAEEGLDIMEVDLVICFDANISPIRMIQRMGRTGRKSEGRVVVLACEGAELSGYKSKQAKGKAVSKQMSNPKCFSFHPSLRMVPHVYKPEKKLVKFSIEEFVPRGKKVKEDDAVLMPEYKLKLTDVETDLLEKYFDPAKQDNWIPSLIAFPHFQAYPSCAYKIAHSTRTAMLIDSMQHLQGLSFNGLDDEITEECFKVETDNVAEDDVARKEPETDTSSFMGITKTKEKHHSFLFGSEFTAVDSNNNILILSVPVFPLKVFSPTKSSFPHSSSSPLKASSEEHAEVPMDEHENDVIVTSLHEEICKAEVIGTVIPNVVDDDSHSVEAVDLSPRLTNLLLSGVVPESPVHKCTSNKDKDCYTTPDHDTNFIHLVQTKNDEAVNETTPNKEVGISKINLPNNSIEKFALGSKRVGEMQTPVTNLSNKSYSKDWLLSSGEKSISQPKKKLKRLRKFCDIKSGKEEIVGRSSVSYRSCAPSGHASRGRRKLLNDDARVFIDDEAEASSEASDDEVENGEDSYCGSFIDDRINPTMAATQAETGQVDMMAIYRRSLLTQSPIVDFSPDNTIPTYDESAAGTTNASNGNSSSSLSAHLNNNNNTKRLSSDIVVIPSTSGPADDTKRRKLSFSKGGCGSLPVCNLEKEIFLKLKGDARKEMTWQVDEFDDDDDEFYKGIDLDALEEQASKQLRSRSNLSSDKPKIQDDFLDLPSFDLGI